MNILILHEIDWFKKVIFEPHHLAELFSKNNKIFVIDCKESDVKNLLKGIHTQIIKDIHRVYDDASITVIHPPSILLKGFNRFTHFLFCKNTIKNTIIKNNIQVILLYSVATNAIQTIEIAKELGIPVIYRALDVGHGLVRNTIISKIVKHYEKKVIKNATKILPTTNALGRYIEKMGGAKNKIETFQLGINIKDFKPLEKDFELAKELGITNKDKIIVFVGTIYPFVGLIEIVRDFEKIEKKNPAIKLLIIGGGPTYKKLYELIIKKKLGKKIILTNFKPQKEIPRYISLADICINPFNVNFITNDILPTKILEYFACRKPVLSTPLSGTKELLPDESFGISYSSSENFSENILKLIEDEEKIERMGMQGYNYVIKNHDWKILSEKLIQIFEKIINSN